MLDPKRRQTLLSLLDALNQLTEEDQHNARDFEASRFENDRDVPTVDERLQVEGADSFERFERRINNLDNKLKSFLNSAPQLGSSVGILSSAFRFRERLAQILFLFRENAADLFPRKVPRRPRAEHSFKAFKERRRKGIKRKPPPNVRRPTVDESLDPECFPEQFEALACDLTRFLNSLNEFSEYTDEAVSSAILTFEADLQYWASCLKVYKSRFRYPAVQRYIHDIATEMGEHIDDISNHLTVFLEVGVPTIRFAQDRGTSNLLNLSTVATFFSAVTAQMLQFSIGIAPQTVRSEIVNIFWFSSLVFSIAAAVNSLLGLTWKQAMYRSPGHRVPWWVLIWIKRSPLVFLVFSVACFSFGLVFFTYASGQNTSTSTIITVLTALTSFGLAAVSTWFATERWIFMRHSGKKWLSDVLYEVAERFYELPCMGAFSWVRQGSVKFAHTISTTFVRAVVLFFSVIARMYSVLHRRNGVKDGAAVTLEPLPSINLPPSLAVQSLSDAGDALPLSSTTGGVQTQNRDRPSAPTNSRSRFASAVRTVIMLTKSKTTGHLSPLSPQDPHRKHTGSSGESHSEEMSGSAVPGSRVVSLVPLLQSLQPTQDLAAHQALVRHLQFSPNGKYLATSSWDRTAVIFKVGDPCISHRILAHPQGFVGQVAWSPSGSLLLTKLNRGVKIWTDEGVCRKTIDRRRAVESVVWLPGGEAFLSVEGSDVVKLDLNGKTLDTYNFDRMKIHDVAVTSDSQRALAVGPLLASPTGLHPSRSRVEKRIVVYNLDTKQVESQTPVMNDVRDITMAKSGMDALVSYENKAPPQLWKLELVKGREHTTATTGRLTLRHTYMPKVQVDFAGPSYFGGEDDLLVLCAGKAGDIHIWDRESGALLHHVRAQALGGDLTSIAWNHALNHPFMFATGCHDGAVRIWTTVRDEGAMEGDEDADYRRWRNSPAGSLTSLILESKM